MFTTLQLMQRQQQRRYRRQRRWQQTAATSPPLDCAEKSHGGCGQQQHPSMFSFSLQHVRFAGAPLLCNTCASLVPPSPSPDAAAELTKAMQTALLMKKVKANKRGISSLMAATQAEPIVSPLQQSAPKRKKFSRGSAIVAAAAAANTTLVVDRAFSRFSQALLASAGRCSLCDLRTANPPAHTNDVVDRLFSLHTAAHLPAASNGARSSNLAMLCGACASYFSLATLRV